MMDSLGFGDQWLVVSDYSHRGNSVATPCPQKPAQVGVRNPAPGCAHQKGTIEVWKAAASGSNAPCWRG